MSNDAFVRIRYIGKQESKRDNIIKGSTRFWPNQGASLRIPESQAPLYLRHADEFVQETADHVVSDIRAGIQKPEHVDTIVDLIALMTYEDANRIRDAAIKHLKDLKANPPPIASGEPAPTDEQAMAANRIRIIQRAIEQLDPKDESHVTLDGKPKVQAVRDLSKLTDVTSREIQEVLDLQSVA